MSVPNMYAIAFCDDNGRRQLSAFSDSGKKDLLARYISDLGGNKYGDWYSLPSDSAVDDCLQRAKDLGGVSYNLPVR